MELLNNPGPLSESTTGIACWQVGEVYSRGILAMINKVGYNRTPKIEHRASKQRVKRMSDRGQGGNLRALITGISGFVGSHLAEYLLEHTDWQVVRLRRQPLGRISS
jgi:hypothetical protein